MKNEIVMTVKKAIMKTTFALRRHSPEILVCAGVIGTVAGTVMACIATTKLEEVVASSRKTIEDIRDAESDKQFSENNNYTKEDAQKDLAITYIKTGAKIAALYTPAALVGIASIGCILVSHKIMKDRNVALAAAYAVVDKSFREYRRLVKEKYGENEDYNFRHGVTEDSFIDENGNKIIKKEAAFINKDTDTSRFFDEYNAWWNKNPRYNMNFLNAQQQYANDKLTTLGYLFLNDVYDMLGFEKTSYGQMVGWIYNPADKKLANYVDFGLYNTSKDQVREFIRGNESSILLDFNVDGVIVYDAFGKVADNERN